MELMEKLEKFSPDNEINKLKEMLGNPEISEGQKEIIKETIKEWVAWQEFKVGSKIILLLRKGRLSSGKFAKGRVVSKSTAVPMVEVEVENGKSFLVSPSIIGKEEEWFI